MKIKMLTAIAGTDFAAKRGDIVDFIDDEECKRLIEAGYAEPVKEERQKSTFQKREKAAK